MSLSNETACLHHVTQRTTLTAIVPKSHTIVYNSCACIFPCFGILIFLNSLQSIMHGNDHTVRPDVDGKREFLVDLAYDVCLRLSTLQIQLLATPTKICHCYFLSACECSLLMADTLQFGTGDD